MRNNTLEIELTSPRKERSMQTKKKIFDAALHLLETYGYEYLTVANICKTAGVSNGSFYHFFQSKDSLLEYYLVAAFEKFEGEFSKPSTGNIVLDLSRCYELYLSFLLEQKLEFVQNYYTTKNKALDNHDVKQLAGRNIPIFFRTIELIQKAQEDGYLKKKVVPEELADQLCVLEKGNIFDWCVTDGAYDLKKQSKEMLKSYMHYYVTDKFLTEFKDFYED